MRAQRGFVDCAVGHAARHQTLVLRGVTDDQRHTGANTGKQVQPCFDFTQFQANAAQLDLKVVAAEKLQLTVRAITRQIAAAVQPVTGNERVVDKPFGSKLVQPQITPCNADTTNVQLTGDPRWHRRITLVEHVKTGVGKGSADGQLARRNVGTGLQRPDTADHCGFGRTIDVVQAGMRQTLLKQPGHCGRQLPAATEHILQGVTGADLFDLQKQLQHGRHEDHRGNALFTHHLRQVTRLEMPAGTGDDQPASREQRPEDLPGRGVETEWNLVQHAAGCATELLTPQQHIAQPAMRDHRTLGQPRSAGGIQHIRKVVGVHRDALRLRIVRRALGPEHGIGLHVEDRHFAFRSL